MDEQTTAQTTGTQQTEKPKVKRGINKGYLLAAILAVAGAGAFYWRDSQAKDKQDTDKATILKLQSDLAAAKTKSSSSTETTTSTLPKTETPAVSTVPSTATKDNIVASIKSGNTAALEGYMASSVHVAIAASGGVFDHTPTEAIADLKYLNSAVAPWDFTLSSTVLAKYGSGDYKDYFKSNSVVGKSSDGKVVVFNFNDAGKINAVFMSVSTDLL